MATETPSTNSPLLSTVALAPITPGHPPKLRATRLSTLHRRHPHGVTSSVPCPGSTTPPPVLPKQNLPTWTVAATLFHYLLKIPVSAPKIPVLSWSECPISGGFGFGCAKLVDITATRVILVL